MSIIIFSRAVHSGKTTELIQWCGQRKNIGGILMPDINGRRNILDIKTQQAFIAECNDYSNTKDVLQIGSYVFYKEVFNAANSILIKTLHLKPDWLVIDEIGKLELLQKGFYYSLKKIIESGEYTSSYKNLLLVIRDSLYSQVVSFFGIKSYKLINQLSSM